MAGFVRDQNLLLGMLAVQMDFVGRNQLLDAMHEWMADRSQPLGAILRRRGEIDDETLALLERLLAKHIERHGSPEASIAAVAQAGNLPVAVLSLAAPDADRTVGVPRPPEPTVRYRSLRPHREGGLGKVLVAQDVELRREVALKEIKDQFADDPASRARFVLEAEVTGNLEHPGIVPVYGLGAYPDGRPYYAMRFIRGESLKESLARTHRGRPCDFRRDPLALRRLLGRFLAICDAVSYAHSRGVLHRDLKPANVMLGEYGETLVVDWGLAKTVDSADATTHADRPIASASGSTPTQAGSVLGTPEYMSPEQAAGRLDQVGPGSDQYSLGAILYCLLTGHPPVVGDDLGEMLSRTQRGDVAPPRRLNPSAPPALEAITRRAMALVPANRYPSVRALRDDVERWLADEPVAAYPEPPIARAARWSRRNRVKVAAGLSLLLAAVIGLGVGLVAVGREQRRTAEQRDAAQFALKEARGAIGAFLHDVSEKHLRLAPGMRAVRRDLAALAVQKYRDLLALRPDDKSLEVELSNALVQFANAATRAGDEPSGLAAYEEAARMFEQRGDGPQFARLAADAGDELVLRQKIDLAAGLVTRGLDAQRRTVAGGDDSAAARALLARLLTRAASLAAGGDPAEDHPNRKAALLREADKLWAELKATESDDPATLAAFARTKVNLSQVVTKYLSAEAEVSAALAALAKASKLMPRSPDLRFLSSLAHQALATNQEQFNVPGKVTSRERQVEELAWLAEWDPSETLYQKQLAYARFALGEAQRAVGATAKAQATLRLATEQAMTVLRRDPFDPALASELATAMETLADIELATMNAGRARDLYTRAVEVQTEALKKGASLSAVSRHLVRIHQRRAELENKANDHGAQLRARLAAVAVMEKARAALSHEGRQMQLDGLLGVILDAYLSAARAGNRTELDRLGHSAAAVAERATGRCAVLLKSRVRQGQGQAALIAREWRKALALFDEDLAGLRLARQEASWHPYLAVAEADGLRGRAEALLGLGHSDRHLQACHDHLARMSRLTGLDCLAGLPVRTDRSLTAQEYWRRVAQVARPVHVNVRCRRGDLQITMPFYLLDPGPGDDPLAAHLRAWQEDYDLRFDDPPFGRRAQAKLAEARKSKTQFTLLMSYWLKLPAFSPTSSDDPHILPGLAGDLERLVTRLIADARSDPSDIERQLSIAEGMTYLSPVVRRMRTADRKGKLIDEWLAAVRAAPRPPGDLRLLPGLAAAELLGADLTRISNPLQALAHLDRAERAVVPALVAAPQRLDLLRLAGDVYRERQGVWRSLNRPEAAIADLARAEMMFRLAAKMSPKDRTLAETAFIILDEARFELATSQDKRLESLPRPDRLNVPLPPKPRDGQLDAVRRKMERLEEKKRQEGGSKPGDLPLNPDDYARIIMLVEGVLDGYKKFWCYVAIKPSKYEDVRHLQTEGKLNLFKFDPYGELIISGEGVVPPLVVTAKVAEVYQTELLGFFGWADVAKVRQFLARHRPKVP